MSPHSDDRAYRRKRMLEDKRKRLEKQTNEDNIKQPYIKPKKINPREIEQYNEE